MESSYPGYLTPEISSLVGYGAGGYGAGPYDGGAGGAGGTPGTMSNPFNAARFPRIIVKAGLALPVADCILGSGVLGTDTIGGTTMVDISADVQSISIRRGRETPFDHADPGSCSITLRNTSGHYDPLNLSGPYVSGGESLISIGIPVTVEAEWPAGTSYRRFTGKLTGVTLDAGFVPSATFTCADGLEDLGRTYLAEEPPVFDNETTGQRLHNLADRANWPTTARAIDLGNDTLGATTLGGTALELMQQVEQTEFGLVWVDGGGNLVFYDRFREQNADRSVFVQAALTDTAGTDELGMMELEMSLSRDQIVNDAHATRQPHVSDPEGDQPVEQSASDAVSVATYGTLSLTTEVGTLKRSDPEVKSMLEGIILRSKDGAVRVRQVRLNALRGELWATLLPLTLVDRISVRRDYGPSTISKQLIVQGFAEDITVSPANWEITLSTSEPSPVEHYCVLGEGLLGTGIKGW